MESLVKKLSEIQVTLKAPKNQYNSFGKYNYRNAEDILEGVKPLLKGLVLTLNDEMVEVGGRVYVKSTSSITDGKDTISNVAFAREPEEQKGMNEAQITGSASSYARKYSLGGLFLLDDTKDADSDEVTRLSKGDPKPAFNSRKSKATTSSVSKEVDSSPQQEQEVSNEEAEADKQTETPVRRSFRRRG